MVCVPVRCSGKAPKNSSGQRELLLQPLPRTAAALTADAATAPSCAALATLPAGSVLSSRATHAGAAEHLRNVRSEVIRARAAAAQP